MSEKETVSRFLKTAAKAMAGTSQAESHDMLAMQVLALIPQGAKVFCPERTEIEKTIAQLLQNRTTDYKEAEVTVEQASGAIAETGTVICSSAAGKTLQASLLPSHHIALVASDTIFVDLDAFFAAQVSPPPTNITFITGPSRTADIELSLVVGVHGPEKLDVIVI
jgi:L-lactate dehydrogenase complex protein LldG